MKLLSEKKFTKNSSGIETTKITTYLTKDEYKRLRSVYKSSGYKPQGFIKKLLFERYSTLNKALVLRLINIFINLKNNNDIDTEEIDDIITELKYLK